MAVVVNTNTQSIFAQRSLSKNTLNLQRNMERLSTGFRINRAADDAAGLSISEKQTARIQGYVKAKQNASDGISMMQTSEGALGIIQDNLQRIRELVVQGLNGTNSSNEIDALQREINERIQIIADVGADSEFNGVTLLDGTTNRALQTGADEGQTTTLSLLSGTANANTGVDIDVTQESVAAGNTANGTLVEGITDGAGAAAANFSLGEIRISGTTIDSYSVLNSVAGAVNIDLVATPAGGTFGLGTIDTMLDNVSRMRSELGAIQNALESKIEYLDIAMENESAARSRIKDVDVARESSALLKNQILQQSAAAMISQANQTPQIALQLLG